VELTLAGRTFSVPTAQVIAAKELTVCNTFDQPRAVIARPLDGIAVKGQAVRATLPAGSVAAFRFAV
jgi:alpha-L-arabinofuranosidase